MPAAYRFSIARSFTSNRLPTLRCAFGLLADAVELQVGDPQARLARLAARTPASWAKRMPLVAACTLK